MTSEHPTEPNAARGTLPSPPSEQVPQEQQAGPASRPSTVPPSRSAYDSRSASGSIDEEAAAGNLDVGRVYLLLKAIIREQTATLRGMLRSRDDGDAAWRANLQNQHAEVLDEIRRNTTEMARAARDAASAYQTIRNEVLNHDRRLVQYGERLDALERLTTEQTDLEISPRLARVEKQLLDLLARTG